MTPPFLSIVIPAHNEEYRLPPSLQKIADFLQTQSYSAEVVVVENGSQDRTLEIAREFARQVPCLHVVSEAARGKGLAVRRGMLEAQGEYRFICDADLSMPIDQVNRFLPPALLHADVAIGSREIAGSMRYHEPAYRHLIGRGFNSIVRWMALPGLQDTQCGFKCFSAQAAKDVFNRQSLTGMSFDVEILFIARRLGYTIHEIPIDWYFDPDSRVRLIQDSLQMFLDLLTIRRNARMGLYDSPVRSS